MSMTSRERVITALAHKEPDRVPMDLGSTTVTGIDIEAYRNLCKFLQVENCEAELLEPCTRLAVVDEELRRRLGVDCTCIYPSSLASEEEWREGPATYRVDEYGTVRMMPDDGFWFDPVRFPLQDLTLDHLSRYPWPDPYDQRRVVGKACEAEWLFTHTDYAIVAVPPQLVLTRAQQMRGFAEFLMDLLVDPKLAGTILDKITEFNAIVAERFLGEVGPFVQVVMVADDLGTQSAMMISPALYRRMIKPRHAEWVKIVKKASNAKILFHSDGDVYPIIPDLIEIGVDILNPVQASAAEMDPGRLKREFGADLCFWGGVDTQRVLPWGTAEDVEAEVKHRLDQLGQGGGYILAAVHNIMHEVPPGNALALFRAGREHGRYPLHL